MTRRIGGVFVVCLAVVILFLLLPFTPRYSTKEVTAELAQIRAELPLARARWASHQISSYDVGVVGGVPLACMLDVTLQVREGEVAAIIEQDVAGQRATRPFESNSVCSFSGLLIPMMFEQVEESLAQIDPAEMYLLVEFDPVYGFVTDFQIGCRSRQVSDCGSRFTFGDFRPVAEE